MHEEAKKKQQWFEDQLANRRELAKQAEQALQNTIGHLEEYHAREVMLWTEIKLQYGVRAQGHTTKINHLKMALDELRAKTQMGADCIQTLLSSHKDRF